MPSSWMWHYRVDQLQFNDPSSSVKLFFFVTMFQTTPPGGVGKLPNCESADVNIHSDYDNEMECNVKPKEPSWKLVMFDGIDLPR